MFTELMHCDLMETEEDHYDILGVDRDATDLELKRAYRREVLRWHPDKSDAPADEAAERFKLVSHAYTVLSDPAQRQAYDDGDEYSREQDYIYDARARWEEFMRMDECARQAMRRKEQRKEASFRAGSVVFVAWSAVLAAATWQQSYTAPLLFPSALGPLSSRDLGDISVRTDFREFTAGLVARRRASLGPFSEFVAELPLLSMVVKAHTMYLNITFRPFDLQPAVRDRNSAVGGQPLSGVLLSSPRRVGRKVHTIYTYVYAPSGVALRWPPAGSVCVRLLRSGPVKSRARAAWFDLLSATVDGRLRPFTLEAADPEDCQSSVGAVSLAGVVGGAAVLTGVAMRMRWACLSRWGGVGG